MSDSFHGIHFINNNIYYSTDSFIVIIVHSFWMRRSCLRVWVLKWVLRVEASQVWSQSQSQSSSLCLSVLVCPRYNYKCNLFILSNSSKLGDFSTDNVILFPHLGNFKININNSVETWSWVHGNSDCVKRTMNAMYGIKIHIIGGNQIVQNRIVFTLILSLLHSH